jgi:hypothetical protein
MLKYIHGKESVLLLKKDDEQKEIEFELQYLLSLTVQERFQLMRRKSREMLALLEQNGHGKTAEVVKRK